MDRQTIIQNKIVSHQALTYDDILLLPNYSSLKRRDCDISASLHPKIKLKLPVLSSPMDTVTEAEMAEAMARYGGLGVIHRSLSAQEQADMVRQVKEVRLEDTAKAAVDDKNRLLVAAAVGVGADVLERVSFLLQAGVDMIVVDSAHGYSKSVIETVVSLRAKYDSLVIAAGNIATYDGARALVDAGADVLRVGMGPGSICTTRIVTGMGVPQVSAISAVVRATAHDKVAIIADGGIRQTGDIAKALAFGAHVVMLGSMLSGFEQSPGEEVKADGKVYKTYRGMGSVAAMKKGGAQRYGQKKDQDRKGLIAEGVEALVPAKGDVNDFLYQIAGSLRSSMFYLGARNLDELFVSSRAIHISHAGLLESHPHSIKIVDAGGNYQLK